MDKIKSNSDLKYGLIWFEKEAFEETTETYVAKIEKIGSKTGIIVPDNFLGKKVKIQFLKKMPKKKLKEIECEQGADLTELS